MINVFTRLLDINARELKKLNKTVEQINALEPKFKKLKDSDFKKKTEEFKKEFQKKENFDNLLPEAFALVREAAVRALGQRLYDVQLIAGLALFHGKIAEQKTGEGKTLSAVAPLYTRALTGKGVHLVTVNDYLARVGAGWNAPIFEFLGLTTGVIAGEQKSYIYDASYSDKTLGDERLEHLKPVNRKESYSADITYGTNNEFGFDYLRDNMVSSLENMVQRGHYYSIVDEVDQVLIDEARTPLIISAPDTEPTDKYYKFAQMVDKLNADTDYVIDEKDRAANLTEHGISKVEKILGVDNLYETDFDSIHHIENALKARALFSNDKEYIVKDDQIIIVDEFTGRLMPGRRWSDGLHQAIEAKEGVHIQQESKTLATISFQNYFRMYDHLAGMTGTAVTEADEFRKIYNLDVVVIPTNKPITRKDHNDLIYKTTAAKYSAVVEDIEIRRKNGQPILLGTTSIEKNEIIGRLLKRKKIPHNILNAKNHEREALIIADAGKPGAVTIATNMAGRGVDIVLGGSPPDREPGESFEKFRNTKAYKAWEDEHKKVLNAGGLHVIGTERHESRRIDNQLRGRSGRQGDPGSTRFYLSLEDDLMRIFGGEQISSIMGRLRLPEDQPIENKLISRAIEQAQIKVEGFNFDRRKRVVEYDDVANQQRDIIYKERKKVLESKNLKDEVLEKLENQIDKILISSKSVEDGSIDMDRIIVSLMEMVPFDDRSKNTLKDTIRKLKDEDKIRTLLVNTIKDTHKQREKQVGDDQMRMIEKYAYLGAIDHLWIDHIDHVDGLRESVGIRAYGQRDPIVEFKNEAFMLFEKLLDRIDDELALRIFRIQVTTPRTEIPLDQARTNVDTRDDTGLINETADEVAATGEPAFETKATTALAKSQEKGITKTKKPGRNDPCWCGKKDISGKPVKYKKCHYPN